MYCRECGNQIPDNAISCSKCGTRKGVGVNFCQMCSYHTTEHTEFCFNCGAKQHNIISQKMKNTKLAELQKKANFHKKFMKIEKFFAVGGIIFTVILIAILVLRKEPANIPDPSNLKIGSNYFMYDSMRRIGNTYYYSSDISDEVAEYWVQGRALVGYILFSLFVFLTSSINYLIQKKSYTKVLKAIKEARNVL